MSIEQTSGLAERLGRPLLYAYGVTKEGAFQAWFGARMTYEGLKLQNGDIVSGFDVLSTGILYPVRSMADDDNDGPTRYVIVENQSSIELDTREKYGFGHSLKVLPSISGHLVDRLRIYTKASHLQLTQMSFLQLWGEKE